jgi:hypothetical protein
MTLPGVRNRFRWSRPQVAFIQTRVRHVLAFVGVVGLVIGCLPVAAQNSEDDPVPPGQYHLTMLPVEQLSEHNVSRQGDAALNIKTIHWEHGETDHFIFHAETGFSLPQLAAFAEWSYADIKRDIGIEQDSFERKCHVYVFLNEQAWHEFVGSGNMEPWTGGWCTGRELFFWSRPHFKFQGPTLPHEMTHLVLHRFVGGDIPLWLNEGLAEFEGIRLYRTYMKIRGYNITNARDHLARDQYIPLKELTGAVDYPTGNDEVTAFYTEAQRLISFLYFQHGGMVPLLRFLKLQSDGARFDSAWQEVYSSKYSGLDAFETKFIAYLTKEKE